ncbi:MAG: SRPBCC domain-containing protein [Burkholderiales bacterium]|nr:SRPBCC domain-containing protein [Burkholderiales bacterium]
MVDILHKIATKAPLEALYQAVATRAGVAGWWTAETTGDSQVGGSLLFRFTTKGVEVGTIEVKVLELAPNKRVLWQVTGGPQEWLGTTISFELKQEGEFCVLLFRHQGWKEPVEFMHHCSTKWAMFLMSLKELVETGKGRPSPDDVKIDDWN